MTNPIFTKAATLREMIAGRGLKVGELETSTNRNGDCSAYFDCEGGDRIRVSDHDTVCNDSYKWFVSATDENVDRFVQRRLWNMAVTAELAIIDKMAAKRESDARHAAFAGQQDRTAANNEALHAAGYDVDKMTKNQRKNAIKALRAA